MLKLDIKTAKPNPTDFLFQELAAPKSRQLYLKTTALHISQHSNSVFTPVPHSHGNTRHAATVGIVMLPLDIRTFTYRIYCTSDLRKYQTYSQALLLHYPIG